jgi:mycoredoxin
MARKVLDDAGVDYEWIDIDQDQAAVEEVMRLNRGMRSVPTIVFPDGTILVEPSRRVLGARLAEVQPSSPADVRFSSDADIPGCGTGPVGRFAFVLRELKGILNRTPA